MEEILFEIVSYAKVNSVVIIKVKCLELEEPFFTYTVGLKNFNKLSSEELEFNIYRNVRKRILDSNASISEVDDKMKSVSNKISNYNKIIGDKNES